MKHVVCIIRDVKLAGYKLPIFGPTVASVVRAVADAVNNKDQGDIFKHAEDFELFEVGTFDDETGMFDCDLPRSVVQCSALVRG